MIELSPFYNKIMHLNYDSQQLLMLQKEIMCLLREEHTSAYEAVLSKIQI